MDERDLGYLMAVCGALITTPRALARWLGAAGTPREMVRSAERREQALPPGADRLGDEALARVAAIDDRAAGAALEALERSGATALLPGDGRYPRAFSDLLDAPPLLYAKGDVGALNGRTIAIVGSRTATSYGRRVAADLARESCVLDACVVSGLARGIDAAAHRGALDARGRTAAVIGSGLLALYPSYHSLFADEIVAGGGCVLSEFPPALEAKPYHFPMRNRLVAALGQATIVVEAGARSGALITARLADELGRPVFAIPGDVDRPTSAGTNALIRDGVPLVTGPHDVAALLGWRTARGESPSAAVDHPLIGHIEAGATSVEELCGRTGLPPSALLAQLTLLELDGRVERRDGGSFATVKSSRSPNGRR